MPSVSERRRAYRELHASGCFVQPNPWDVGSARYLQHLGFPALATTSAGFAFTRGLPDNGVTRENVLAHLAEIVAATDVPVNADFEGGFAHEPRGVGESVRLCVETGVAGLSIEDSTGERERPLHELDLAVARIAAARAAIDRAGGEAILTARAECFVAGRPDLDDAVRRLRAYAAAGADCLYAPGLRTREQIETVVRAVAPKPVNVLWSAPGEITVPLLAGLGVRRVSVGGALARAAWGGFLRAARPLAERGSFDGFVELAQSPELNAFFGEDARGRRAPDPRPS